jgi:hypothetical protein
MGDLSTVPPYEEKQIRCPKLGHQVNFAYCCIEQQELPCARALKCWNSQFDVETHLRERLGPEGFVRCFEHPPPTKIATLIELIEHARNVAEKGTCESEDDLLPVP